MTWTLIGSDTVADTGGVDITSLTVATGVSVSVNQTIIVHTTYNNNGTGGGAGAAGCVMDDSLGNTFVPKSLVQDGSNGQNIQTFYCIVANAGTSKPRIRANPTPGTSTLGAGGTAFTMEVWSGSDGSSTSDGYLGVLSTGPGTGA